MNLFWMLFAFGYLRAVLLAVGYLLLSVVALIVVAAVMQGA